MNHQPHPIAWGMHQAMLNVIYGFNVRRNGGQTLTEFEVQCYENLCRCTAKFAEARRLELEAAIEEHERRAEKE